jgi:ribosomal protein L7/L12
MDPGQPPPLDPAALDALTAAIAGGRKIEAIKLYREATGASLVEAKGAVEALEAAVPAAGAASVSQATPRSSTLSDAQRNAVMGALAQGRKIIAIKLYREATGVGLKAAKDAVEALEAGRPELATSSGRPDLAMRPASSGKPAVVFAVLMLALLLGFVAAAFVVHPLAH